MNRPAVAGALGPPARRNAVPSLVAVVLASVALAHALDRQQERHVEPRVQIEAMRARADQRGDIELAVQLVNRLTRIWERSRASSEEYAARTALQRGATFRSVGGFADLLIKGVSPSPTWPCRGPDPVAISVSHQDISRSSTESLAWSDDLRNRASESSVPEVGSRRPALSLEVQAKGLDLPRIPW